MCTAAAVAAPTAAAQLDEPVRGACPPLLVAPSRDWAVEKGGGTMRSEPDMTPDRGQAAGETT